MSRRRRIVLLLFAVPVAAVAALSWRLAAEDYRALLAQGLAAALGQPVAIADLKLRLTPAPTAVALGVTAGARGELAIDRLDAVADPERLLHGELRLLRLRARGAVVERALLPLVAASTAGGERSPHLERLEVEDLILKEGERRLGPFRLAATLGPGLAPRTVTLHQTDGTLELRLTAAEGGGFTLTAAGRGWQPPVAGAPTVERLRLEGSLSAAGLDLPKVELGLFGGEIAGRAALTRGDGWRLSGRLHATGLAPARLPGGGALRDRLRGTVDGDGDFEAAAATLDALPPRLRAGARIALRDGRWQGAGEALPLERLEATLRWRNGALAAEQVTLAAAGATAEAATLSFKGGKPAFEGVTLHYDGRRHGPYRVALEPGGDAAGYRQLTVSREDGHAGLRLRPAADGATALTLEATGWQPPLGPPLLFDHLHAEGAWHDGALDLGRVDAAGYGGTLSGRLVLARHRAWRLAASFDAAGVALEPLLAALGHRAASGTLGGSGQLALSGPTLDRLGADPASDERELEADFVLTDGVLYNADLQQAATLPSPTERRGGDTPFERIKGSLHWRGERLAVSGLQITAQNLKARGEVTVERLHALGGEVEVGIRGATLLTSVPLQVGGTLDDPTLRLTDAALAGAGIGTAVIGPGLGTAIGIKAGQWLQNLGKALTKDSPSEPATEPPRK